MLFLRLFLLLLFGTFAVAAPTSPPSPQRFDSPETDVQPPQTIRWIIPVEGLGYWRRHPDEGKNVMNTYYFCTIRDSCRIDSSRGQGYRFYPC